MRMVKLCVITLIVLEILAIVTHFDVLLRYTGSVISAFMPIFIIGIGFVMILKSVFK